MQPNQVMLGRSKLYLIWRVCDNSGKGAAHVAVHFINSAPQRMNKRIPQGQTGNVLVMSARA
jgi:hypothetical protein